jgi:hypothetical protein
MESSQQSSKPGKSSPGSRKSSAPAKPGHLVKLTLQLPEELATHLHSEASRLGCDATAIVLRALEREAEQPLPKRKRKSPVAQGDGAR